jgi:uncharacterized membrane protein
MDVLLAILFRWMHIAAAAVAIGGAFFMRILVPRALAGLEPAQREEIFLKLRRGFKMVIHTSILLLIVSGVYNTMGNWKAYNEIPALSQPLWGTHVLLALFIFSIALYVLAGKMPPAKHAHWMALNLLLMALTLAVAAGLKYVRDHRGTLAAPAPASSAHLE